ncbi:hypothetical protein CRYUN_Cryun06bG0178500 [Craigia yunnanensis]
MGFPLTFSASNLYGKQCCSQHKLVVYSKRVSGLEEAMRITRERELQSTKKFKRRSPLRRGKVSPCLPVPDHIPKPPYLTLVQNGDIINIDVTMYLNGYHGDTSKTFFYGNVSGALKRLVTVTECTEKGRAVCKDGVPVSRKLEKE